MNKLWFSLLITTACSSKETADSASDTAESTDTTDTNDTTVDTDTPPTSSLSGNIKFADGTEVNSSNVRIQMCLESCFIGMLEGDEFTFPALPDGTYALDVVPLAGDGERAYATPLDIIEINTEVEEYTIENTINIYNFDVIEDPITTGTVNASGDLVIEVDANGFTPREGYEDYTFLASVRISPEDVGFAFEGLPSEIVGIWQLGAFEAHISPAWSFSVQNSGLEPGTSLRVFNGDYEQKTWLEVGSAEVDENGTIVADDGTGIQILSTLVITQ